MPPDAQTIQDIAVELGVDPSFIEKDWHAVRVLSAIASHSPTDIAPVFSGGTSLSKAHGIIQRFSEDLDFRAHFISGAPAKRSTLRAFKQQIFSTMESVDGIKLDRNLVEQSGKHFKFPLTYENIFESPGALRPHLQVEFSYTQPRCALDKKPIYSFVSRFSNSEPDTHISCLSPLETAADKFCALIWRVPNRDRKKQTDDPAMIRHLHDLHALHSTISSNTRLFAETANAAFNVDMTSLNRRVDGNLITAARRTLDTLTEDELYPDEYQLFVSGMSYARENEAISFDDALSGFEKIICLVEEEPSPPITNRRCSDQ